jgi:hypothetical protein
MTTTRTTSLAAVALLALAVPPTHAGELAFEAHAGYYQLAAEKSASAVFGSRGGPTFGGAVRYTVWRGVFVSAGVRTFSKDGERVFVASPASPVQKLGFPLKVQLTPIVLEAGYRLRDAHLVVPYAAVGVSISKYKEESEVAGEAFNEDRTKAGLVGALGVEVGRGHFRLGAEVGYSSATDAVGIGGVSRVYGENDLGGLHAIGKAIFAF